MLLFFCAGIFLVGVLNTLGIVSMVGGNRYESIGLAGLYYGLFGGGWRLGHLGDLPTLPPLAITNSQPVADGEGN